jgi:hypothetical protein
MNRCIILIASLFLSFLTISSTASAGASDWARVAHAASLRNDSVGATEDGGASTIASWSTIRSPRMFALLEVRL